MSKLRDDFNYGVVKNFNEKDGYGFINSIMKMYIFIFQL